MSRSLTTRRRQELARPQAHTIPKNADLVIADLSGSMSLGAGQTGRSKEECLKQALLAQGDRIAVLGFNSLVFETTAATLPSAFGGTFLDLALDHALGLEPMHVIVMCDGEPNSEKFALEAARRLAADCIIDALYIGDEHNESAVAFMKRLAEVGRGRYLAYDLDNLKGPLLLDRKIAGLLAGPASETIKL